MSDQYINDGSFSINPTRDPDVFRATIAPPGDAKLRDVRLERKPSGHLMGFIQPASPDEELALKAFRSAERKGEVDLSRLPEGVSARYDTYDGKPALVYLLDDVAGKDGKPFELRPGQVLVFDRLERAVQFREDLAAGKIADGQKPPAAYSGYAATFDGRVTTPAAWIQIARHGKDGKPLPEKDHRVFFSGSNRAYDRSVYLAATGRVETGVGLDV